MTSRAGYFQDAQVPDIERRLASVMRIGVVSELDEANARVRVKAGNVTTGWIPWTASRAGPDRQWSAPEVGEQVIVAAPSGDLAQGVVVGSIYRDKHPAPGNNRNVSVEVWADGASQSYDREAHTFHLSVPSGGTARVTVGGTSWVLTDGGATLTTPLTTINGRVKINGDLRVSGGIIAGNGINTGGDVVASGVSLTGHTHGGVDRGSDDTNPPSGDGGGGGGGGESGPPVAGSANGKTFTTTTEPDGSKTVTFSDGSTMRTDAYGNRIQSMSTMDGPVYYVQAQQPYGIDIGGGVLSGWGPTGERIYTDASGKPVPSVTYRPDGIAIDANGVGRLPDPITITQTVPSGDPLPSNQNKFA